MTSTSTSSSTSSADARCTDEVILNQWHPIATAAEMPVGVVQQTSLLGESVSYAIADDGRTSAWRSRDAFRVGSRFDPAAIPDALPVMTEYLYLWTSLGLPPTTLFEIPEFHEPDRRNLHAGTLGVHVSAPRAIENFLDMGHFPFVHTDILGIEPHTEVVEYEVNIDSGTNDIWATGCFFFQPMAAATSLDGQLSEYTYRVPHPYCVLLYKSCPVDENRRDAIGLFVQPMTAEYVRANMFLSLIDADNTDSVIRRFQQTIFAQDKPILENQYPKRLPLDPRAETPIRADKVAIAYRRWLSDLGVTYGVIPAA